MENTSQNSELMHSALEFYRTVCRESTESDKSKIADQIDRMIPGFSRTLTMAMVCGNFDLNTEHDTLTLTRLPNTHINTDGSLRVQLVKAIRAYFVIGLRESVNVVDGLELESKVIYAPIQTPNKRLTTRFAFINKMRELGVIVNIGDTNASCQQTT